MQQWIESAWPDAIAVMLEFLHDGQAEDGFVCRMEQHMNANQAVEKFTPLP